MEVRQISVFVENKPGSIFKLTTLLFEQNINLLALNVAETEDYGLARIIVDKTDKAVDILKKNSLLCAVNNDIVCICVPDKVGELNKILQVIAKNNVDISYMYSILANTTKKAYMVLKAKAVGSIREALGKDGIELATAEDLGIE